MIVSIVGGWTLGNLLGHDGFMPIGPVEETIAKTDWLTLYSVPGVVETIYHRMRCNLAISPLDVHRTRVR